MCNVQHMLSTIDIVICNVQHMLSTVDIVMCIVQHMLLTWTLANTLRSDIVMCHIQHVLSISTLATIFMDSAQAGNNELSGLTNIPYIRCRCMHYLPCISMTRCKQAIWNCLE